MNFEAIYIWTKNYVFFFVYKYFGQVDMTSVVPPARPAFSFLFPHSRTNSLHFSPSAVQSIVAWVSVHGRGIENTLKPTCCKSIKSDCHAALKIKVNKSNILERCNSFASCDESWEYQNHVTWRFTVLQILIYIFRTQYFLGKTCTSTPVTIIRGSAILFLFIGSWSGHIFCRLALSFSPLQSCTADSKWEGANERRHSKSRWHSFSTSQDGELVQCKKAETRIPIGAPRSLIVESLRINLYTRPLAGLPDFGFEVKSSQKLTLIVWYVAQFDAFWPFQVRLLRLCISLSLFTCSRDREKRNSNRRWFHACTFEDRFYKWKNAKTCVIMKRA